MKFSIPRASPSNNPFRDLSESWLSMVSHRHIVKVESVGKEWREADKH